MSGERLSFVISRQLSLQNQRRGGPLTGLRESGYIPAIHGRYLADLLAEVHSIAPETLVDGTGFDLQTATVPGARAQIPVVERMVVRAEHLTNNPLLGIALGMRMHAVTYGYVGFAALSSATVGDALQLAERYAPTVTNALSLRLLVRGTQASLVVEEQVPLGRARRMMMLALLVGLARIGLTLTGIPNKGKIELAMPAPSTWNGHPIADVVPIRFGASRHRFVFPAASLQQRILSADPAAAALARSQCEVELQKLASPATTVARASVAMASAAVFPSRDAVARALGMSTRTLVRKLRAEGTSYRAVLDAARQHRSELLLDRAELSLDEVAHRVGYSDVANFTRAFRRWTGTTPAAFRGGARRGEWDPATARH